MQSTLTLQQQEAIALKLSGMLLPAGLGDEHNACSIAAINLALSGELSDDIPECMSEVIGVWIIKIQDNMPYAMRNSSEWKRLLPLAAGTGRKLEKERLAIMVDWMWESVLPTVQPIADLKGFGQEWKNMLLERTFPAARDVRIAASDASVNDTDSDAYANCSIYASRASLTAADVLTTSSCIHPGFAVQSIALTANYAALVIYSRAWATADDNNSYAAANTASANAWAGFDPCGLLEKLVNLED
jgi:hypothetical protein